MVTYFTKFAEVLIVISIALKILFTIMVIYQVLSLKLPIGEIKDFNFDTNEYLCGGKQDDNKKAYTTQRSNLFHTYLGTLIQ